MHSGMYTVKDARLGGWKEGGGYEEIPEDFWVHWNGDYSGDIWFTGVSPSRVEMSEESLDATIKLPYDLLEKIVLEKMRNELISKIEDMDQDKFKEALKCLL